MALFLEISEKACSITWGEYNTQQVGHTGQLYCALITTWTWAAVLNMYNVSKKCTKEIVQFKKSLL